MKRSDKAIKQAILNPPPIDDRYCDLGIAIVVRALRDYVQGEQYEHADRSRLSHRQLIHLRRFESAKRFLESDELVIYTKMPAKYLIDISRQSKRMYAG